MAHQINPHQQKLAEKLTILNDRGIGMLTRIFNIKKACAETKSKPSFLLDKNLESVLRQIQKKFPAVDKSQFQALTSIKTDIIKSLAIYYFTFVDLLEFRDHVTDLLTTIDACQVHFDIALNYDLTKAYLDLISIYISLMILLSRVDDRKIVLGLYNIATDLIHGHGDASFPRLGQMIIDYEQPLRKLHDEFVPHVRSIGDAIQSLSPVYDRRTCKVSDWRAKNLLSLLATSQTVHLMDTSEILPCEYLSQETIERWIIYTMIVCPQQLIMNSKCMQLFEKALSSSFVHVLYRDELLLTHQYLHQNLDIYKSYRQLKLTELLNDTFKRAITEQPLYRRERRKYIRPQLKELALVFADQPALLGPKLLTAFTALSLARDEIVWLLRHGENFPVKLQKETNKKAAGTTRDDYSDRTFPEFLFYIEELRHLITIYSSVIKQYYIECLSTLDSNDLQSNIKNLNMSCTEDESILLTSFYNTITTLATSTSADLRALRLDWFRMQAYTSVTKKSSLSSISLSHNENFAQIMNSIAFHSKCVDDIETLLYETSDLSIFYFYLTQFDHLFSSCIYYPSQIRYAIAFPLICQHFINATHELCPEERQQIGDLSLKSSHAFIDEICKQIKSTVSEIANEYFLMNEQLLPKNAVISRLRKKAPAEQLSKKHSSSSKHEASTGQNGTSVKIPLPGDESRRSNRRDMTKTDKLMMVLNELCFSISYRKQITIWEHKFLPNEYLISHLENRFNKSLSEMVNYRPPAMEIAKPSELLSSVESYMDILTLVESHCQIDTTRIFNEVLLQQSQPLDSAGNETITSLYTHWFLEVLVKRITMGTIVYSPIRRSFVSIHQQDLTLPFDPEEYASFNELRALVELIKPYGCKYLCEMILYRCVQQINEIRKLTHSQRDLLNNLRINFDKPAQMKLYLKQLEHVDLLLQRVILIGVLLQLKSLIEDALEDVLCKRMPFLMVTLEHFYSQYKTTTFSNDPQHHLLINEMISSTGTSTIIDSTLCQALINQKNSMNNNNTTASDQTPSINESDEYILSCLIMVYIAVALPRLARLESTKYIVALDAHANNCHCLIRAINTLITTFFFEHGQRHIEDRCKEFLALASSSLLRLIDVDSGQNNKYSSTSNNSTSNNSNGLSNDIIHKEATYILLEQFVNQCPYLTRDLLETCFPSSVLRNAFFIISSNIE
ncbi:unnamed protein product [Rotaria magnacalcarata]|uniref:Uncharacterized protein n=3 Tax=Rotaria magnacalcarata TaxID=392030 RepID=A0A815KP16_9BILA|nr:unnamed protein product [Rotaria magnacalcarata]CAF1922584.1 unnamed protein product [Rotaria magnacalcarata]